ncbi:DUF4150 domain-containing protein (plasmid) [Burkholderia sp. FERM BP-3421]|uniref:hypothetical protein n=1 Tax=Burkholderia sp. FERM BP-3421 TaxID=1494466 RepID=UPI00235FBD11|nr:hypothetical protein [Burkholderia sp. FERM BP-3421]WDD90514.1 DUF4150 domain-containing protein [Burkholderia sp. FERM BP-3421]
MQPVRAHNGEPGSMGGVMSGIVSTQPRHVIGADKVMIHDGAPQTRMTDTNLPAAMKTIAPSQIITISLS